MEGSKTRPGFSAGNETPASNPAGEASARLNRTIIGRALHLRPPSQPQPVAGSALMAREETPAVPESVTDEVTEKLTPRQGHSGKSRFPAFARLFGRWTTGGGFLSRSRMSRVEDDLDVPRDAWVSRVAIFVVAALLSFLVALAVLKVHGCSRAVSPASAPAQSSALTASPLAGAAAMVMAAPAAQHDPPAAALAVASADAPVAGAGQPAAVRPRLAHRAAAKAGRPPAGPGLGVAGRPGPTRLGPRKPRPADPSYKESLMPLQM